MRVGWFIILCLALGGCATSPSATATCTDLISTGGGLLKYCQTGRHIDVTESGVDPAADPPAVRVVDDPEVLRGLQRLAGLHPEFQASRRLVARACVADGADYLSVSVRDLKRMLSGQAAPQAGAATAQPRPEPNGLGARAGAAASGPSGRTPDQFS